MSKRQRLLERSDFASAAPTDRQGGKAPCMPGASAGPSEAAGAAASGSGFTPAQHPGQDLTDDAILNRPRSNSRAERTAAWQILQLCKHVLWLDAQRRPRGRALDPPSELLWWNRTNDLTQWTQQRILDEEVEEHFLERLEALIRQDLTDPSVVAIGRATRATRATHADQGLTEEEQDVHSLPGPQRAALKAARG